MTFGRNIQKTVEYSLHVQFSCTFAILSTFCLSTPKINHANWWSLWIALPNLEAWGLPITARTIGRRSLGEKI